MSVSVRQARREDADFLAWVMLTASRSHLARGIWDLIIGADEQVCLRYLARLAVAEPRSLYHYKNFIVAAIDTQPAAALCGFEMRSDTWTLVANAMATVQHDLGWTANDFAASEQRMTPIWNCFPEPIGADWIIENVATKPACRGQGAVSALIDKVLRTGAERGHRLAQITTYIGNDFARLVYEKSGFQFSDEKRCTEIATLLGTPGFMRFLRKLRG